MKKLLLLLIFVFPLFVNGQNKGTEGISIVAGPGLSYVFGGDNLSSKFGYLAGIEKVVYQVNETSMFTAGINYTFQGAKYVENTEPEMASVKLLKSVSADENQASGTVNLGYLNIPVLYRYQKQNGLFVEAGIQTGFLLSAKDIPDSGESIDGKDKIKFVDIRLPLGIGYWLTNNISVGIRGDIGLASLSSNGAVLHSNADTHQNFMLLGLLRINLHQYN